MLKANEEVVKIAEGTPLGRRGISSIAVKPLGWKQEELANELVQAVAEASQKKFLDSIDDTSKIETLMEKFKDHRDKEDAKESSDKSPSEILDGKIDMYKPAYSYVVYGGVKRINGEKTPAPPASMMSMGKAVESGWLDECTSKEVRQFAAIVLDRTGMVESEETEGNGSGASMLRSVETNA